MTSHIRIPYTPAEVRALVAFHRRYAMPPSSTTHSNRGTDEFDETPDLPGEVEEADDALVERQRQLADELSDVDQNDPTDGSVFFDSDTGEVDDPLDFDDPLDDDDGDEDDEL